MRDNVWILNLNLDLNLLSTGGKMIQVYRSASETIAITEAYTGNGICGNVECGE